MKVLVVHSNEAIVAKLKAHCGHCTFSSASSGLDGLLACRTEYFDLILCGLDLPVVTGIEMIRSIRNISENRETPVFFLAEGKETEEHFRIVNKMNARLLTLDQIKEINFLGDGKITT